VKARKIRISYFSKRSYRTRRVSLDRAELAKAKAKQQVAEAELSFATIKAPFDGIVDRLQQQEGSLVKKEEVSRPCPITA